MEVDVGTSGDEVNGSALEPSCDLTVAASMAYEEPGCPDGQLIPLSRKRMGPNLGRLGQAHRARMLPSD